MNSVAVAISTVGDGNMFEPTDQENKAIIRNRRTWLKRHGIALEEATRLNISYDTSDFCRYRIIDSSECGEGMKDGNTEFADALVTTSVGHSLFLPVADCVATTLFDAEHGVLMLSHLGRHSLEQQGGIKSVQFLCDNFGTNPENLQVWLGPAPNKDVYPIFKLDNQGMKEAVFSQLEQAGVIREHITDNSADTATDDNYFSYSEYTRGNKPLAGRFAMVAKML